MSINSKELALNFAAGGVVVAGTAFLAVKFSSKWAALFWSIPLTLIPVIFFLHFKKAKQSEITDFVGAIIPSLLVLLGYVIVLSISLKKTTFWKAVMISTIAFLVFAIIFWILVTPTKKINII